MDDFTSESSIGGVGVFHSSEPKKARILWGFVFSLFFSVIGFYTFNIYTRTKLEPEFSYKFSEFPLQEIPFPAVTICVPLIEKNKFSNVYKFKIDPTRKLRDVDQNYLAAIIQAAAPELGSKFHNYLTLVDPQRTVFYLQVYFPFWKEAFADPLSGGGCLYNWLFMLCNRLMNHVLTDYGFCFSYNLEGFPTIFNTEVISNDFKSYSRDGKLSQSYSNSTVNIYYNLFISEANQSVEWNLEKGYLTNEREVLPVRAIYYSGFGFHTSTNVKKYTLFFHMSNEILTPFHQPKLIRKSSRLFLGAKLYKVDESLRPYPPEKRNCYFEGERKLKFFKTYTKAHCQFECLTNFTLAQCGCVKFSMPRENSARICGLNETSCYLQVAKNWNLTCGCLHPCTYIEYSFEQEEEKISKPLIQMRILFLTIFGQMMEVSSVYSIYQGFADFGGMLGTLFGASLISLIEIFYFMALTAIKKKFKTQRRIEQVQLSEFASSSTIHGVQFIFDNLRHKIIRVFWIFAFIFAMSCCIYNSRDSYLKLSVEPEMETTTNLKSINEIPFPVITVCTPLFTKEKFDVNLMEFNYKFLKSNLALKDLTYDQYHSLIANLYWASPNILHLYIRGYAYYILNQTAENFLIYRSEVDLFPFLFRSHFDVDDLLYDCKFQGKVFPCSKLFKKVLAVQKICYAFNLQSHRQIFNDEISKNFDSYGRFEKDEECQWSLDRGYFYNSSDQRPARATQDGSLELGMKVSIKYQNRETPAYYLSLPNEILTHISTLKFLNFDTQKVVTLSAKLKRMDEGLRKFSSQNRGCFFQDERKLQFFSTYTRSNCMRECFTNYTLKLCDCVVFVLPHNNQTKLCYSSLELKCYYKGFVNFPDFNDSTNPCGCLPTCNDIEYSLTEDENPLKTKVENYDALHLKFQFSGASQILEEEIRVAFGPREFLTNVGGFLGLYLGCSFISVLEVFYFFSVFLFGIFKKLKSRIGGKNEEQLEVNETRKENFGPTLFEVFDLEEFG